MYFKSDIFAHLLFISFAAAAVAKAGAEEIIIIFVTTLLLELISFCLFDMIDQRFPLFWAM